ncbi:tetratricopeptide repeat protein [Nordella sp. HKS 07]|uniref:BTAD domain-containing putative transcriptional regulator n=1 Tax=Nordella sp. HKS 07 TaxID=2712222 RepID=UPI0013E0ED97|nr:BTAD domain-containing putative transcriptional regulator [Nordella sp. HKS 07]QIG49288.1 tetratricopeptide repeat protein [Nordella sp. HKS 07]
MRNRRQSNVMGTVKTAQNRQLPSSGTSLEIRLFGPMTAQIGGKTLVIASKKTRALLAYLVQREGVDIARTTLTGLLWGERSETQARASLRQSLSELRAALGEAADALAATKEAITWRAGAAWLDTRTLEEAAQSEDPVTLGDAAGLFSGDVLEGMAIDEPAFEQWLAGERERFRLLAATVRGRLAKSAEGAGRLEEAVAHAQQLLNLDPLQEHVHRMLMRLYAAQGRPDAALAQFERCERELSNQLGVTPDAETAALARSIRARRREERPRKDVKPVPAMSDKISVAVTPFANLSSDREHGFFADGLTQDIIGALAKISDLFVVSSGARDLTSKDARFILEGNVRAAGSRIRVTAHLIDGQSGRHVWSERYEGDLGDIFAVQDQITQAIALAMQVKLTSGDMARLWEGQTRNLRAWEKMVAARDAFLRFNRTDNTGARGLLEEALAIDPGYTGAIILHGLTFWWDARFNRAIAPDDSLGLAEKDVETALKLKPGLGIAYMLRGGIAWLRDDHGKAVEFAEQAVSLSPSDAHSVAFLAMLYMYSGEYEKSVATIHHAIRLCPHYPSWYTYYLALNRLWMSDFSAATELGELYLRQEPDEPFALVLMATILAFHGRKTEAAEMIKELLKRSPDFGTTEIRLSQHYRDPAKLKKVVAALRAAGLPD